jgi:methyl-accepting chemotaxis protein
MTIRNKLIAMAVVVLAVIATMAGVTYHRGGSIVTGLVSTAGMEIIRSAALNVDARLNKVEALVMTAAETVRDAMLRLSITGEDGIEKIVTSLTNRMKSEGIIDIYMGHEATGGFSDGTGWKEPADYDCRTRSWYKQAVAAEKGTVIFTEPYVDAITKKMVISTAMAIHDSAGKLLGVVGGDMDLSALNDYVVNLHIFGKGNGMLLLGSGIIAAGPRKEDLLKANLTKDERFPEPLRNVTKRMIAGETGSRRYSYEGVEKEMFYAPTQRGFFLGILFPVSEITAIVHELTFVLLAIAVVALVVTGGVIFVIARGLTKSIDSMERVTEKLGAGDLTVKYDDSGKDEIAHISQILNAMVASLRDVMTSIRKESEETARRAETLASLSEETLSLMEEVSGSIEEVQDMVERSSSALQEANASIEEIASSAQSVAKTSGDGAENAARASASAGTSVKEVDEVIGNIRNAAGESAKSIDRIRALAKSVEDISGFVTTITSIADQTNLLALNAAIEAARAGEAGRGFAVVAEEVRKLAEESARAANEVNKLIDGLQRHSGDSIAATEKTGTILEETMRGAEATQKKLTAAVESIAKMAEAVQSIAAVSEEQAAASEEMTSAVQSVTESTGEVVESVTSIQAASRETTKAAEGIATEAQDMAATSETLQRLVARFTLDDVPQTGLVPEKN